MPEIIGLGQGRLTWPRMERVGDRYGAVAFQKGDAIGFAYSDILAKVHGVRGTLKARVIETRQSTHIGDLIRGLFPQTPEIGEELTLGTGTFGTEYTDRGSEVLTCRPDDGRPDDWYDPTVLYRLHEQTVLLWIEVDDAVAS